MNVLEILQIIIGFIGLILIAIPFSENYRIINVKYVFYGIIAQIFLGLILLKVPFVISVFEILGQGVTVLQLSLIHI